MAEDPEFSAKIARAREDQADYFMDECLQIADSAEPETANVAKLQVYVREKYAAKCKPKKWGEKATETHFTATTNNFVVFPPERLREWQERAAIALAQ